MVGTGMGHRLRAGKPPQYFTKPARLTQPPTLSGTGNEYQSKSGDTVWVNVWVAGKTVIHC